ncbi:MAG: hypothetical protein EOP60_10940 [Sphingomonadales bacterium]|nr:MAG: hypothetical protein EOP60_10940 [Sphingomonadales bacterium]
MIALALVLLFQREPLPAYVEAVRCAGLTIAQYRAAADESPESAEALDASLFWSLAVGERARKDGVKQKRFEQDVAEAAGHAAGELAAGDTAAQAELARCEARVPD